MLSSDQIRSAVDAALASTPFIDVHTHLFMPSLGSIGLWGIDELITYHYLEAELFRSSLGHARGIFHSLQAAEGRSDLADFVRRERSGIGGDARSGCGAACIRSADVRLRSEKSARVFRGARLSRTHRGRVQAGGNQRGGDDQRSSRSGGGSAVGEGRAGSFAVSSGAASRSHPE